MTPKKNTQQNNNNNNNNKKHTSCAVAQRKSSNFWSPSFHLTSFSFNWSSDLPYHVNLWARVCIRGSVNIPCQYPNLPRWIIANYKRTKKDIKTQLQLFVCMHVCGRRFNNKLNVHRLWISLLMSQAAVRKRIETLGEINWLGTLFYRFIDVICRCQYAV